MHLTYRLGLSFAVGIYTASIPTYGAYSKRDHSLCACIHCPRNYIITDNRSHHSRILAGVDVVGSQTRFAVVESQAAEAGIPSVVIGILSAAVGIQVGTPFEIEVGTPSAEAEGR